MLDIQPLIKELNTLYPKYRFNKSNKTYNAEAIINIRCKEGVLEMAYYGGASCGYIVISTDFKDIFEHIKAALSEYVVIEFIDNNRKGHFEIFNKKGDC